MAKQVKEIKGGVGKFIAMTFIGLGLFILGLILSIVVGPVILASQSSAGAGTFIVVFGFILTFGPGLAFMGIGIPCWIAKGIAIKNNK